MNNLVATHADASRMRVGRNHHRKGFCVAVGVVHGLDGCLKLCAHVAAQGRIYTLGNKSGFFLVKRAYAVVHGLPGILLVQQAAFGIEAHGIALREFLRVPVGKAQAGGAGKALGGKQGAIVVGPCKVVGDNGYNHAVTFQWLGGPSRQCAGARPHCAGRPGLLRAGRRR